jgi:hypothetical protein
MATLRIKWVINKAELVPTEYEINDPDNMLSYVQPQMRYFNIANKRSDIGSFDTCALWFQRKIDFSGMDKFDTRVVQGVYGKGTITAVGGIKNGPMSDDALQCMGWSKQLLTTFIKVVGNTHYIDGTRQKLPQFILASDLEQLRKNVHFFLLWGNGTNINTRSLNNKYLEITLNLFTTKDEK